MIPNASGAVAANIEVVADDAGLRAFVERLRGAPWVAVDTEFLRERTYYPKLCLVQIATDSDLACVDPLAVSDLSPLASLWADAGVIKVFHSATQDLEILQQACGEIPRPLFDTQVAATLLGHPDQIGYARLVSERLGVDLDKQHTRSDWSRRPLSPEELDYAADDVRYLARLYPELDAELQRRGRRAWLDDEFAALVDPERYRPDPARAWRRIRGGRRLRPDQRRVLARLAEWRERLAMASDRPRGWVVKDDTLLALAQKRPRDAAGLARVRDLPEAVQRRHGDDLLEVIAAAADQPPLPGVEDEPAPVLPPDRAPLVDLLMAGLRERSAATGIATGALANRKELERLVAGERDLPLLRGWRREAAGEALLELLEGKAALRGSGEGPDWIDPA